MKSQTRLERILGSIAPMRKEERKKKEKEIEPPFLFLAILKASLGSTQGPSFASEDELLPRQIIEWNNLTSFTHPLLVVVVCVSTQQPHPACEMRYSASCWIGSHRSATAQRSDAVGCVFPSCPFLFYGQDRSQQSSGGPIDRLRSFLLPTK